jgi:membrane-associated protein
MESKWVFISFYLLSSAETGLFVSGFFLPGDSLFLAGIYNRELIENVLFIESPFINVVLLSIMVALAGILGNIVGYWFGLKVDIPYNKEDSFGLKEVFSAVQRFFLSTEAENYSLRGFTNICEIFAPIVAGINYGQEKFMFYNIVSSFMVVYINFAGHYLYGFY